MDEEVARWAAQPIDTGQPHSPFIPIVLGPAIVPRVTEVEAAREAPELAVLSVQAHSQGDEPLEVALPALAAASELDDRRARFYCDIVMDALPEVARRQLEELMRIEGHEYKSEFAKRYLSKGLEEGREEGRAQALLTVLSARGLQVSESQRKQILECTDPEQVDRWLTLAAKATSVDELFS